MVFVVVGAGEQRVQVVAVHVAALWNVLGGLADGEAVLDDRLALCDVPQRHLVAHGGVGKGRHLPRAVIDGLAGGKGLQRHGHHVPGGNLYQFIH